MQLTSDLSSARCCVLQVNFDLIVDSSLDMARLDVQNADYQDVSGLLHDS